MENVDRVVHDGICGIRRVTGTKEILCDVCCFRNTPHDCVNSVDCCYGWYYERDTSKDGEMYVYAQKYRLNERELNQMRRLVKYGPPRNFAVRKRMQSYIACNGREVVTYRCGTKSQAIIEYYKFFREKTIKRLSKATATHKGFYQFSIYCTCKLGGGHDLQQARSSAIRVVNAYFDYIIDQEAKNGN